MHTPFVTRVDVQKVRRFISLFLLLSLLTGCSLLLSPPDVKVRDLSIASFTSKGAEIDLYLSVTNTNSFSLRMLGYNYDLKVMEIPLASGGVRESVEFKAGSSTDIRIPVRVVFKNLFEILKKGPDPEKIPYTLNAGLEIDSPLGLQSIPVESRGTFKVPEKYRPEYYLKQLRNIIGPQAE